MAGATGPDAPWALAIDIGTTFCVAAGREADGSTHIIEIGGLRRIPSVVVLDEDGTVVVGQAAENLAAANPGRAVRAPKSRIGDPAPVVIGGRLHDVIDLVAALLRHVHDGAVLQHGGRPAAHVCLTHPAIWGRPRIEQLRAAAQRAGIVEPVLLPEPVAAAVAYAADTALPVGSYVAVYDLGGGTFDTAVLQAGPDGFTVVGRPVGEDRLGGELFDELLANHIGERLDPVVWEALQLSDDLRWQQAAAALRLEARRVKEALSSHPYAELLVALPGGFVQQRVTRPELEQLVRPHIEQSVERLAQVVADAGLRPDQLAAVCLSGGASHAPMVEAAIRSAFGTVTIGRRGDPKTSVALGATIAVGRSAPAPSPTAGPAVQDRLNEVPTLGRLAHSGPPARLSVVPGAALRAAPPRRVFVPVAAIVVVAALVAAVLLLRGPDRDAELATAAARSASSSARPASTTTPMAQKRVAQKPVAPSTSTSGLPAVSLESPAELFLGTEIRRRWDLDPAAGAVTVTVTLTNRAAGSFRWHHDEPVPKELAGDASLVQTNPPAEVLQADPMFRWWYELPAGQTMTVVYTVARQAPWPAVLDAAALAAWDASRTAATAARQAEILRANQLTDTMAAPVPVSTVLPGTVPTSMAPAVPTGSGSAPGVSPQAPPLGGPQVIVVPGPTPDTAAPPTVSIRGPSQVCAGVRSHLEGVASGAVSGVWSIPSFAITDASWSPAAPTQFLEPNNSAIGGTFRAALQVVNAANVAAAATFDFAVVDCSPDPAVQIVAEQAVVCAGSNSFFTGVASGATTGTWSLPQFGLADASWSPDAPTQYVNPFPGAAGSTFTWTLTVIGPTGKTATAQLPFTVVDC